MSKDAVLSPNLGLILNQAPLSIPSRGLRDGHNFRIHNGILNNLNLGWSRFSDDWTLNGPVMFIDNFFPRELSEQLLFGTQTDIYVYEPTTDTVRFLTPRYTVGTARFEAPNTIIGSGTSWAANVSVGDEIHIGAVTADPEASWFTVTDVVSDTELTVAETVTTGTLDDYTVRNLFTASTSNIWDFDVFIRDGDSGDDLWFATNGIDPVVTWNGEDDTVTLHPELGFTCGTLANYQNMMIYGDIVYGGASLPSTIINSNINLPLQAGDTGTGLSEQFVIHGGTDSIINMSSLGDNLVIYSERHIILAQFVGDPLVFIFRAAADSIGPVAHNAIADFGDYHQFVGSDSSYSFDGVSLTEVDPQVWRAMIRQADPLRKFRMFGHFDEENGEIIWSIPLAADQTAGDTLGQAEIAISQHYLEDVQDHEDTPYSKRDFPFTATGFYERDEEIRWEDLDEQWAEYNFAWNDKFFALGFPQNLAGDKDGVIYILGEQQTADGALLPSFVHFGRRSTGDGRSRNLIKRIYPFARQFPEQTLTVTLHLGDHAAGPLDRSDMKMFSLDLPEGQHFTSHFRAARFMELRVSSPGTPWILEGYDVDVVEGGER